MRRRSFRCVIDSNQPKKPIPPGLHGGDRRSAGARSSSQNENLKAFVADIAVKTGKGRSTVARDVTRAKKVAVLDDIAGTCLDKGDEIDALGKLPEGDNTRPLIHTQPLPNTLKTYLTLLTPFIGGVGLSN